MSSRPATDGRCDSLRPPATRSRAEGSSRPRTTRRAATAPDASVEVAVARDSERIQLLRPFPAWDGRDLLDLPVLVKASGRCTTDHISAAGPWLRYRGHLDRISDNLFLGAVNAFTGETGMGRDPLDGETRPFPEIARRLSDEGVDWCVVGGRNYGEGSSREHAAMEPRHRGGRAVLAISFARIHETNLKKQGLLALTFVDPATYDAIEEGDRVSIVELTDLAPGRAVECRIERAGSDPIPFTCTHTMNEDQLEWFRAGSALNCIRLRRR